MRRVRLIASIMGFLLIATTLLPPQTAQATEPMIGEEEAIAILQEYNIVRGDADGNLNLDARLTRAEAAAIFVRSMKAENLADLMMDSVPFTDTKGHWAVREIAVAERLGLMRGDGNGNFRPDAQITYAEIYTVLLRMLKMEPAGPWNADAIMRQAATLPIVPAGIDSSAPAVRRKIFWALAATITSVPVDGHSSLLRKYVDQDPPVIRLDLPSALTTDADYTVSGTATGAFRVLVNGKPAQLDRQTGRFSYRTPVDIGTNTLVVEAFDAAGNRSVQPLTVERQGTISRLTISGPKSFLANTSTMLTITATDSKGNTLPLTDVTVEMSGDVATFNKTSHTLVTGSKAGKGSLTLRAGKASATFYFEVVAPSSQASRLVIMPINGGRPLAMDKEELVTVQVVDSFGKVVADDFGRVITLSHFGSAPFTITPVTPVTEKGIATFKIKGLGMGSATLTASSPGMETVSTSLEVLSGKRVMLVPSVKSLMPDGTSSTTIKAVLQDEFGRNVINDTGYDMQIALTATGTDSVLTNPYLTIPRGKADSGSVTAKLTAGISPGIATIKGAFTSSHDLSIQTLEYPVDTPLPGVKLELVTTTVPINPGGRATVKVRVVDGNNRLVTNGSYAFQLTASTSNDDPIVKGGLPDGVTITYPNSPYYPVDDGKAANDPANNPYSVIGRTDRGEATVSLSYSRSGVVTVKAVLLPSTQEAYNPSTGIGPASSSANLFAPPVQINFRGNPSRLLVSADSAIGYDLKAGAVGGTGTMTLRARVVDHYGTTLPGFSELVTITRLSDGDGVTSVIGYEQRRAVNGVVEFPIQASDRAGVDRYQLSTGSLVSEPIIVSVRKTPTYQPSVVAIRGVKEGGIYPTSGFVGPEADYMDIQLEPQVFDELESEYWVQAKVYRQGESNPFYTQALDLRNPLPVIRIPKAVLKPGKYRYTVVLNNGYRDSLPSLALDDHTEAVVATYNDSYRLTGARFDAETGKLYLSTSGLATNGSIDKRKLSIVKGADVISLNSDQVSVVTPISSSQVVLNLGDLAASLDPDRFHGSVTLKAESGWYLGEGGTTVSREGSVPVTPMAVIAGGALDIHGKRLYLYGEGFTQGTLQLGKIQLRTGDESAVTLRPGTATTTDRVLAVTDTQVTIGLSDATYNAVMALEGASLYLTAEKGWLAVSTAKSQAIGGTGHVIGLRVLATSGSYDAATDTLTIRSGGGLKDMQIDPTKLVFRLSPGGAAWTPSVTPAVVATADDSIVIILDPEDAAIFEATFREKNVYLNTQPGWLISPKGWPVLPLPDFSIQIPVMVP